MDFADLPVEVLHEIFKYLPPDILNSSMRLVCRRFALVLSDNIFWKALFERNNDTKKNKHILPAMYGLNEVRGWVGNDNVSWRSLTIAMEKRKIMWGKADDELKCLRFRPPHSALINTVKIINNGEVLVSGGRDRLLCMWRISDLLNDQNQPPLYQNDKAHVGWIWDATFCESNKLYTCGWDATLNLWDVESGISCIKTVNTHSAAMSIDCRPGLVIAGLHSSNVLLVDPRIGIVNDYLTYDAHKFTVTSVKLWENLIVATSEDRSISLYDIRINKILLNRAAKGFGLDNHSFPRSIGIYRDILYVGHSRGTISTYCLRQDLKPEFYFSSGQNRAVNVVKAGLGGIIAGCTDGTVKFITPCQPPVILKEIKPWGIEPGITNFDYHEGILACCASQYIHLYHNEVGICQSFL